MMVSWIDDNLVVGSNETVAKTKGGLMSQFECKDCGELDEYVGCKITCIGNNALKFTQPVILQRYTDKFDLPNRKFPIPATAGGCLTKCDEKDALGPAENQVHIGSWKNDAYHAVLSAANL